MMVNWNRISILLGLLWFGSLIQASSVLTESIDDSVSWKNAHYSRTIDLSKSYVKELDIIDIVNTGDKPQDEYYFIVNDGFDSIPQLSLISFAIFNSITPTEVLHDEIIPHKLFKVKFPTPIAPNSNVELKITYVYTNVLEPLPAKIGMEQVQTLLYRGNKFPYSAYASDDYSLIFSGIAKGQEMELLVENIDELNITPDLPELKPEVEGKTLKYGPLFDEISPLTLSPMGLLYEHNRPLTFVHNLNRSIWIPASDVDQLSIEEYYELTNNGAQLNTGFSRVDWLKGRFQGTRNHFALSHLEIPTSYSKFANYYFSDLVGVISTHQFIKDYLILQPRFPIFGEWKYNFTLGWNENLGEFLHQVNQVEDEYILKVPILNAIRDVTYNNTYLNIYLPENSQFINVSSPIDIKSITVNNELSYLDVAKGHTKVTLHFQDLFDDASRLNVLIKFKYTKLDYISKIAKISGFVFIALISYYGLSLIDLSITDKKKRSTPPASAQSSAPSSASS
ncbi:oligosaccharyltransferase [Scheffersomyces coipomensis]|uniref:oligosaccharyltransferase n=1 Tax=Scheffersomyces coipomensis TaxID=1788519 RepID=UPI00315CDC7D